MGVPLSGRSLLAAIVGSRAIVLIAAALAEVVPWRNPALTSGDGAPLLRSLTSWDGWWYLGIVRDGYHAAPLVDGYRDVAFLPLYPLAIRGLALPWPELAGLVAVALSNGLFVVALVLLGRLGAEVLGDERAWRAPALLAISPFAAPFSMAYAESLFLVLALGAFLAVERDRRAVGGILLALGALARLPGAFLVVPLGLILFRRDGNRLRRSQAWLLLGPLASGAFLLFVAWLSGSPTAYGEAVAGWGRTGPSVDPTGGTIASDPTLYQGVLLLTLLAGVFLLVYLRPDRIPLPYAIVPPIALATVLASGSLESVGRYLAVAFPYAWVLAGRGGPRVRAVGAAISALLLLAVSTASFTGYFVP